MEDIRRYGKFTLIALIFGAIALALVACDTDPNETLLICTSEDPRAPIRMRDVVGWRQGQDLSLKKVNDSAWCVQLSTQTIASYTAVDFINVPGGQSLWFAPAYDPYKQLNGVTAKNGKTEPVLFIRGSVPKMVDLTMTRKWPVDLTRSDAENLRESASASLPPTGTRRVYLAKALATFPASVVHITNDSVSIDLELQHDAIASELRSPYVSDELSKVRDKPLFLTADVPDGTEILFGRLEVEMQGTLWNAESRIYSFKNGKTEPITF